MKTATLVLGVSMIRSLKKARIAAEIKAFKNTDFSDCPELTDEQLSHFRGFLPLARAGLEPDPH